MEHKAHPKNVFITIGGDPYSSMLESGERSILVTDNVETIKNALANTSIEELDLGLCIDIDIDLSPLTQMPHLRTLRLQFKEGAVDGELLGVLSDCKALTSLKIDTRQRQHLDLDMLHSSSIKELTVWAGSAHDTPIPELENIERLYLDCFSNNKVDLSPLQRCGDLEEFSLVSSAASIDLSPLSSCRKLRLLNFSGKDCEIDLMPLQKNTSLEVVDLRDNQLRSIDLQPLSEMSLLELRLDNNRLQEIDLRWLPKSIRKLTLSKNVIEHIDLQPLQGSALETLLLCKNKIQQIDINPLLQCEHLKEVELQSNSMRHEVEHIVELATGMTSEELLLYRKGELDVGLWDRERRVWGDDFIFPYWYLREKQTGVPFGYF